MDQRAETDQVVRLHGSHFDLERWVGGLAHAVMAGIERQAARQGLTAVEFTLLRVFLEKQERTFSQLAAALPIDRERLVQLIGKLVDRGLLHRRGRGIDPRVMLLALTEEGRKIAWALHPRVRAEDSTLLEGVSKEEMDTLSSVVSRIVANQAAFEQSSPQ